MKPAYALFVAEYLKNHNATAAAIAAGYSANGASVQGSRLLKQPSIAAAIAAHEARGAAKSEKTKRSLELTAARIYEELSHLAFFDPASMYDQNGRLLPVKDMPEETRRAIAGVEEDLKGTKLRISSKLGSLELAAKLLGLVRQEQQAQANVTILLAPPIELPATIEHAQLKPEWE